MATVSQSGNVPLGVALNPATFVADVWRHRGLIGQMAFREFDQRYRASSFGMVWALLHPLMMLVIYTVIFSQVFKSKVPGREEQNSVDFALFIYSALLVFNLFSECVSRSASSIVSKPNYVKKVVFPLQALPISVALSASIMAAINLAMLCAFNLLFRQEMPVTLVLAPFVLLPVLMLALGVGYFLASLGVFVRDVEHGLALVLQVLFFVSPIFYSIQQAPPKLQAALRLNPLTVMVENARGALLWGEWPPVGWYLVTLAVGTVALQLGYAWFVKTRGGFADVL